MNSIYHVDATISIKKTEKGAHLFKILGTKIFRPREHEARRKAGFKLNSLCLREKKTIQNKGIWGHGSGKEKALFNKKVQGRG